MTSFENMHPLDAEIGKIIGEAIEAETDPAKRAKLEQAEREDRLFIAMEPCNDGTDDVVFSLAGVPLVRCPAITFNPSRFNAEAN